MMQKDLSKQIGQATKWSGITELAAKLVSPIVNMILARLLAPEAFGVVATITMVISFAELFTDAGFQKYLIQHQFESEDGLNKSTNVAFWTNFVVSAVICVVIFIFRNQIAVLVGSPGLGNSISIASALIIVAAFSSIQMARYKRDFDFKTLFYARIVTTLIPVFVTVPLAVVFRNYWALLIGNLTSHIFNAIILTVKSKWKPGFFYDFRLLKEMLSFSLWTLVESIFVWLTSYIDTFIVANHLNEYYVGVYKTSISTVGSYISIITAAITPILFSALSRYQDDEVQFKKTYYKMQRLIATLIFPLGLGIFIYSDLITAVLLGNQWGEATGFIGIWGLTSAIVIVFSTLSSEVYRSKGNPKTSLIVQLIHLAFLVPVLLISVRHSFEVLYTARALARLQIIIVSMMFMKLLYKFKIFDIIKNVLPMAISTAIMGAVGYGLLLISRNMIWQFATVFICIIVYFTVLLALFPKVRGEVFENDKVKKLVQKIKK